MSAENLKFTINRVASFSFILLWLVGCANSNNHPALVSSLNGNSRAANKLNGSLMITAPRMADTSSRLTPTIQKTQCPIIQLTQVRSVEQSVQTQNGRIIYNRRYMNFPKATYSGSSTYTVKYGDTLFYIAWITGNDFCDLAKQNNIKPPYSLKVGQKLQVGNIFSKPFTSGNTVSSRDPFIQNNQVITTQKPTALGFSQPMISYLEDSSEQDLHKLSSFDKRTVTTVKVPDTASMVSSISQTVSSSLTSSPIFTWLWPTKGKVVWRFSSLEGGNKGIDIAGNKGQPIVATADGRVVYVGNALRGYGNLIIIKHNDDYLSAYAHNDTILVLEQQEIRAGQKLATMGSTGTNSTRLHFEIRFKGKSVNPLQYLPRR